jgi:DNA-binding MarR family transcriptional regulator
VGKKKPERKVASKRREKASKGKPDILPTTQQESAATIEAKARLFNSYPADLTPAERHELMRDGDVRAAAWINELPAPTLDPKCYQTLMCLKSKLGRLVRIEGISAATGLDRGNVGRALAELEQLGLAVRPKGGRSGAKLTPKGEHLACHLLDAANGSDLVSAAAAAEAKAKAQNLH